MQKSSFSERCLNIFLLFVVISMVLSFGLTVKDALLGPTADQGAAWFLALEIILGLVIVLIPKWVAKRLEIYLPPTLYLFFALFIYGSVYLGTVYHFYSVPYWDKGLHLLSGALLGGFSFSAFGALVPEDAIAKISPFFIGMYSVAFAVFCGVLWEFYEFTCDSFGMNLQRYMQAGRPLVGRAALMDTMGDLFADFIGALLFAAVAYLQLKKNRNWLKTFFFKRIEQK